MIQNITCEDNQRKKRILKRSNGLKDEKKQMRNSARIKNVNNVKIGSWKWSYSYYESATRDYNFFYQLVDAIFWFNFYLDSH